MARYTNRLAHETSLYLKQHAHNPVDWYPWGEEAWQRAREQDRPIFLSIGYAACHWCHVMEQESFEDPTVADLLNRHFVSIKVDREERPDLDQVYMAAVQLLSRHGGWPMSVFLTPDRKPFFGGTYFPPEDRWGRPSFSRLLRHIAEIWKEQRPTAMEQAERVTESLRRMMDLEPGEEEPGSDLLRNAATVLGSTFDSTYGGFGSAPKFPHALELRLLLRIAQRFADRDALAMVRQTLDAMALGGMYDHLGGGFHRYSTDARWLVPHFEKMLYDNALLVPAYLEAYQITRLDHYREVAEETLAYVLREMTSPAGPFCSTQDADSEGEEGKYYVWSVAEIEQVLGREEAGLFAPIYDVTQEGNWEGKNILHRGRSYAQEAGLLGLPEAELRQRLRICRQRLLEVRRQRLAPGRDEKVLASWNGLMIAALAQAYQVLENPAYLEAAQKAAAFIFERMRTPAGQLLRSGPPGTQAKNPGFLEDYAFLLDALISLYEADFQPRWLAWAAQLADCMIEQFWDPEGGGFFYTGRRHEQLIARSRDPQDGSIPSGNSMAATALLRLARHSGRQEFWKRAEKTFQAFGALLKAAPQAAAQMLMGLDFYLGPVQEVALVGRPEDEQTRQALRCLRQGFQPKRVLALKAPGELPAEAAPLLPLLAGKTARDTVTVYICQDSTCREPLVGLEALKKTLEKEK